MGSQEARFEALEEYFLSPEQYGQEITIPPDIPERNLTLPGGRRIWLRHGNPFTPNEGESGPVLVRPVYAVRSDGSRLGVGKIVCRHHKLVLLHVLNAFDATTDTLTGCKSMAIAPSYQLAVTTNLPQLKAAIRAFGMTPNFVADPKRLWIEIPELGTRNNPSCILLRSAEKPEFITGFQVGAVWLDEAARYYWSEDKPLEDAILQAEGRFRDQLANVSQMLFTYTNEGDATQVYKRFETDSRPDHKLYRGTTYENGPHLAPGYIAGLLGNLTPEMARQYVLGEVAQFAGNLCYDQFTPDNLDDTLALDQTYSLCLAMDFNVDPGSHAAALPG